jgi:hypothetical protein
MGKPLIVGSRTYRTKEKTMINTVRNLRILVLPLLVTFWPAALPCRADGTDPVGRWNVVVSVEPESVEVDFTVDLLRDQAGNWTGRFSSPIHEIQDRPLKEVTVAGSQVSFKFDTWLRAREPKRPILAFAGEMKPGGNRIEGTTDQEEGVVSFYMTRETSQSTSKGSHPLPQLDLLASSADLKEAFNRDRGKVRLLQLYSPTCRTCRICSRVVDRYVFDTISDPRLQGYIIWEPVLENDSREKAEGAVALVADPRVRHFWADSLEITQIFAEPVGIKEPPVWDLMMVFSATAEWRDIPPVPDYFMYRKLQGLPPDRVLNARVLGEQIQRLLKDR